MSDQTGFDLSTNAVLDTRDIVAAFDEALAWAKTPAECVQIAAEIGLSVRALLDAQDRALDKADSY